MFTRELKTHLYRSHFDTAKWIFASGTDTQENNSLTEKFEKTLEGGGNDSTNKKLDRIVLSNNTDLSFDNPDSEKAL